MLETIREYALERLAEDAGAEDLRRRHAEHFLKLAETDPVGNQAAWLAQVDAERDNLREALAWSFRAEEMGLGLRLAASLWEFWWVRGHLSEGRALAGRGAGPGRVRDSGDSGSRAARGRKPGDAAGRLRAGGRALRAEPCAVGGAGRRLRHRPLAALTGHRRRRAGRPRAGDLAVGARGGALSRVRRPAWPCARGQQPRRDRTRGRRLCEGRVAQ